MKPSFTSLPFRQKQLWLEVILDLLLIAVFGIDRYLQPNSKDPAVAVLIVGLIVPLLYSALKLRTSDDTRLDERDMAIEGRGRHAGYLLTTVGILFILIYSSASDFPFVSSLLGLWLCSRILTNSVQLRIYAGHEAWWPDPIITRLHRRRDERIKSMHERMHP